MKLTASVLLFCAAFSSAVSGAATRKQTWIVEAEGKKFKVQLERGIVRVVDKAIIVHMSIELRDKMRVAVSNATGCQIVDEYIEGAALKGKLACPDGVTPGQSAEMSGK